jgi:S-DNA-T family DNA segregation ATPase FtsK/SpoIIIE
VIGADDLERQRRLVGDLADDLARRRASGSRKGAVGAPLRLVVVDGLGAFRARWPDLDPSGTWERLLSLATDGSAVGIHLLLTAEGVASAPHRLVSACQQRLVFRLGERADHASLGIPASAVPPLPPGRAVSADGPHVVQVARALDGVGAAVARLAGRHDSPGRPPDVAAVGRLPARLGRDAIGASVADGDGSLALPIGLADAGLVPMWLRLAPGAHALVTGPPRSGRTTALVTLGRAAVDAGATVVVVALHHEPWRSAALDHRFPSEDLGELLHRPGPLVVLVDDADRTDDDHRVLAELTAERRPDRHVIAAARADRLRTLYGHWTRELRADRTGVLLHPDPDLDGDLLGARLPRHVAGDTIPGRGWGCGTDPEGVVQVADPTRP